MPYRRDRVPESGPILVPQPVRHRWSSEVTFSWTKVWVSTPITVLNQGVSDNLTPESKNDRQSNLCTQERYTWRGIPINLVPSNEGKYRPEVLSFFLSWRSVFSVTKCWIRVFSIEWWKRCKTNNLRSVIQVGVSSPSLICTHTYNIPGKSLRRVALSVQFVTRPS